MHTLGTISHGTLADGFVMHITPTVPLEQITLGSFVCIREKQWRFFSLICNISLTRSTLVTSAAALSSQAQHLLARALAQEVTATATIRPLVMLDANHKRMAVKHIPISGSTVTDAAEEDIVAIFGSEEQNPAKFFAIGTPLGMATPVCLNLHRFTERSNGIFGKTGTGKTFITRVVLAGLMARTEAVTLVFDMHSEYGLQARTEGSGGFVKGLKTLFPHRVAIFSLDPASTRRRGASPDAIMLLSYSSIQVEDILALQHELNLHTTACEAAYLLYQRYRSQWLAELLRRGDSLKELAELCGAHPESLAALYRKLRVLERMVCFTPDELPHDPLADLISYLDRGVSVIIEFGTCTSTLCYLLLANMITRRIHGHYIDRTEAFLGDPTRHPEPRKLLIAIEEAHKFLNPVAASQTIFGTIAREMRKYYVSLLVVDQRPSGIDPEILSQIGTKVIAQLNDEHDISAVLTGVPDAASIKTVLAGLDSKQQALVVGHAIAMPIVVRTRSYDEAFYRVITPVALHSPDQAISTLY